MGRDMDAEMSKMVGNLGIARGRPSTTEMQPHATPFGGGTAVFDGQQQQNPFGGRESLFSLSKCPPLPPLPLFRSFSLPLARLHQPLRRCVIRTFFINSPKNAVKESLTLNLRTLNFDRLMGRILFFFIPNFDQIYFYLF